MALTKVTSDGITDGTITGTDLATNVDLADNKKIRFGNGNDLQIYHDGSDSYIKDTGTGGLRVNSDAFYVNNAAETENMIRAFENGAVELFYDNSKKFETTSIGATVTGALHATTTNITTQMFMPDNGQIRLGNGDDLQIYHDGNNNQIQATGSGQSLFIKNDYEIQFLSASNEKQLVSKANGAVELYYDNSKKFETTNTGGHFTGKFTFNDGNTNQIAFGNGEDLQIYHDGTDSFILNTTGYMKVLNHVFEVKNDSGNEVILRGSANAAVELYYNNTLRFYTNSDAVTMRGGGDHRCEGNFRPWQDNVSDLGTSSDRWDDIYATNDTIQTSDRNEKNTIVDTDLGLTFVNKLKPVSYKFNNKTRTHYGLIAQDVETTLSDISKPTSGFAGFIKEDIPDKLYVEDDDIPEGKKVGDVKTAAFTTYGLRYNEFISPLIKAVQELSAEVETLKTEVAALKAS